jgi:hypothetical protein
MCILAWSGPYPVSNRSIGLPPGTGDGCWAVSAKRARSSGSGSLRADFSGVQRCPFSMRICPTLRYSVNALPKSLVREIRSLGSVEDGLRENSSPSGPETGFGKSPLTLP